MNKEQYIELLNRMSQSYECEIELLKRDNNSLRWLYDKNVEFLDKCINENRILLNEISELKTKNNNYDTK